jgi:hypothetical protein
MKDDSKFMKGQNTSLFLIALECSDTYYFKIYALFRAQRKLSLSFLAFTVLQA